jgi:glycosyltransferase involved in cell wall biosynthesis
LGVNALRIFLVTITYPPEIGGAAHLISDLAKSLQAHGNHVTVLTCYPTYNVKDVPEKYRRGHRMDEVVDGISIRRIRVPLFSHTNKVGRGVEHILFGVYLFFLTLFSARPDVAMVYSPPLPVPWLACMAGKLRRFPVVVNIQDLFPREAVELGMLKSPLLIRLFEAMERQTYRLASGVTVHSPGNKEHVIQHGGKAGCVHVVYNWVDSDVIRPGQHDNSFARQNHLDGRFVVSYAGTMGWAQDMGTIVDSADHLSDDPKILFMLVGEGVEKEKAMQRSAELGLNNILWLPMQTRETYPDVLAASDVSLVNLHPQLRTPVVPSKLMSIMAAARPVVASLPRESDARQIIAEAGCGIYVDAADGEALAEAIRKMEQNPSLARDMGARGRAFVETHLSREACTSQFETVMRTIKEEYYGLH